MRLTRRAALGLPLEIRVDRRRERAEDMRHEREDHAAQTNQKRAYEEHERDFEPQARQDFLRLAFGAEHVVGGARLAHSFGAGETLLGHA